MTVVRAPAALSLLLRDGTSEQHRLAEEAPFVRTLLGGRTRRDEYAGFVQSLYFVYRELESVLDVHRGHGFLERLDLPGLRRLPGLEADLAWWNGPSWSDALHPSPATRAYCIRIRNLGASAPMLIVGHLYARYLGDLSGGQVLRRAVERTFGLVDGIGTAFYRFGATSERGRLRERFRACLDSLPVDADAAQRIVAEACRAFEHNLELFYELAPSEPERRARPLT